MDLITTALAIILPLCFIGGIFSFIILRQNKENQRVLEQAKQNIAEYQNAIWAGASVISAQQELDPNNLPGKIRVKLLLRVTIPKGKPYTASTTWLVDMIHLPQIQPGSEVSIKVNRDHPSLIYPNMPGMQHLSHE